MVGIMDYIGILLIVLVIFLLVGLILMYNSLVKVENRVNEAFAVVDVYLKKRCDLIPNLVEIVKGYTKYEGEVLTRIVKSRNMVVEAKDSNQSIAGDKALQHDLKDLFALVEGYPDLRAVTNYVALQKELVAVEQELALGREKYNEAVLKYNNKLAIFPINVLGRIIGFRKKIFFEANNEEREVPEIKL